MADHQPLLVACPRCRTRTPWEGNPHRPFCSDRCRTVDLGRWADEEYRIPGPQVDPETIDNLIEFPRKD
ncbi:MAG: DNA gyrase inhibitor YacG [Desulfuromonadales bacterium]|nr:DNA gyrase inhibitor YacG [Desulfuromonadales bacterium]